MRTASAIALGALLLGGAACSNYLSGPALGAKDPNSILNLKDPGPLYVGLEAGQAENYTTQYARFLALYTQQVAGAARQQQGYDLYVVGTSATDGVFAGFYAALPPSAGGGAADARKVESIALAQNDSIYVGIAKVWEAMIIGDAASTFGAVPYSQAFNFTQYPTPKYDDQLTVLSEVQTTLDQALVYLGCDTKGATNLGPSGVLPRGVPRTSEVIYAGVGPDSLVKIYSEVAHSLKARYYLHLAEKDPSNYAKALAQAQLGISSTAHDWNWYANTANGPNQWVSFQGQRGDLSPASAIIHLMKARILSGKDIDNGRFNFYFADAAGAACVLKGNALQPDSGCTGIRPGNNTVLPYGEGNSSFGVFANTAASLRQPQLTYTETQLIIAEAALQTGNATLAKTALNNVRANEVYGADALDGLTNCTGAGGECLFAAQPPLGAATLQDIIEEKYIDLFATPEVYQDYKRTCLPYLSPAPASPSSGTPQAAIPRRLPYGQTAISSDPNTPSVGATAPNADDPTGCPQLTFTSTPAAW